MKKIYALAAVACMALAANAQNGAPLYATGAGDFAGGTWAPATPDEFTYADGVYTLNVANLTQLKISTVSGADAEDAWAAFNGAALTCVYGDAIDVAVALEPGDANIATPWKGDYTITVAGDLSTITLHTDTPEPPKGATPIFLRGDMNSWGAPAEWELKPLEGNEGVYTMTCGEGMLIAVGESFKIADADWNKINLGGGSDTVVPLDADFQVFGGTDPANLTLAAEWNGVAYLDLRTEGEFYFWISNDKTAVPADWDLNLGGVAGVEIEENAAPVYYNLQGVQVAQPENGLYIVVKGGKAVKTLVK